MGYYSLRDPIHNNDIINNGTLGAHILVLLWLKKKTFNGITYFESSVLVQSLAIRMKRGETGVQMERGKRFVGIKERKAVKQRQKGTKSRRM